jgi:hypothetical protein
MLTGRHFQGDRRERRNPRKRLPGVHGVDLEVFTMPSRTQKDWVTAAEAARILQVEPNHLPEFGRRGLVVTRDLPGVRTKYRRDSVEELARNQSSNGSAR